MTQPTPQGPVYVGRREPTGQNLADILERVLDKGIVIVGDIQVRLLDIELLTIKLRLMVASVERAKEMGINWWEGDPFVSSLDEDDRRALTDGGDSAARHEELEQRLRRLEQQVGHREGEHDPGR